MIKIFEEFKENDPYNEENWDDDKVIKYNGTSNWYVGGELLSFDEIIRRAKSGAIEFFKNNPNEKIYYYKDIPIDKFWFENK